MHCQKYFYREMAVFQNLPSSMQMLVLAAFVSLLPVLCFLYIICPDVNVRPLFCTALRDTALHCTRLTIRLRIARNIQ